MKSERLRQIEELCRAARGRDPAGRAAFLDDACAGDPELRREVETLLAWQSRPCNDTPQPPPLETRTIRSAENHMAGEAAPPGLILSGRSTGTGDQEVRTGPKAISHALRGVTRSITSRFRREAAPDPRYYESLGQHLRETVRGRIAGALPLPAGAADTPATQRYFRACAHLLPSERELIVATVELGYSYEQLALAMDCPSAQAARSAAKCALLRLAEEMSRE